MGGLGLSVRVHWLAKWIGGFVSISGILVLAGWAFDRPFITQIAPQWPHMAALTAIGPQGQSRADLIIRTRPRHGGGDGPAGHGHRGARSPAARPGGGDDRDAVGDRRRRRRPRLSDHRLHRRVELQVDPRRRVDETLVVGLWRRSRRPHPDGEQRGERRCGDSQAAGTPVNAISCCASTSMISK